MVKAVGVRLPTRLLVESSGAVVGGRYSFLLLIHDALYALSEFFKRFALLNQFEDRFQKSLRNIQIVHCLTSFRKRFSTSALRILL